MWMLICHGNYGNIGFGGRPEFYARMRDLGITLFAFDYRGYGDSTGAPDERGVYEDATSWRRNVFRRSTGSRQLRRPSSSCIRPKTR